EEGGRGGGRRRGRRETRARGSRERRGGGGEGEVAEVATGEWRERRTGTGDDRVEGGTNTLCAVMGGDAILDTLETELGLHAGDTTTDGRITLEHIECNAACDYAPVIMVNWEFFDNQTPATARQLIDDIRTGHTPHPTRGTQLCPFRDTARTLAGLRPIDEEEV
ncbi:hypothetical protein FEG63_26225, partial [Mycolicibacterium sphagni]|nr:hypothetical protein [Mycolicibacterium sphagni]